jgi:hypothetical protein
MSKRIPALEALLVLRGLIEHERRTFGDYDHLYFGVKDLVAYLEGELEC